MATAGALPEGQEVDSVLSLLQSLDNTVRSQAEAQLDAWSQHPTFLLTLMTRAHNAPTAGSRQLAATLLSWRLPKLWPGLGEEDKARVLSTLLECFGTCTELPVLRALGEACNAMCQTYACYRDALWEDLLRMVAALMNGDVPVRRRIALDLLASLIDSMGMRLCFFYTELSATFAARVRDADVDVQVAALGVVGTLASSWSAAGEDPQHLLGAADAALEIANSALSSPTGARVLAAAIRALANLAPALQSEPLVSASVGLACRILDATGPSGPRSSEQCQVQALGLLRAVVRKSHALLNEQALSAMVPIICRTTKDGAPSVDDLDEVSAPALAARDCLRSMTRALPARVLPIVFDAAQSASQSADALDRAAAVHMISFALCGAREVPSGWAVPLARAMGDATVWVRQAACEGAASLAESLQPSATTTEGLLVLLSALAAILPVESQPELAHKAADATTAICKELSTDEAAPALQVLVPALLQALQTAAESATRAVAANEQGADAAPIASAAAAHATALGAVASTAADHFAPFAAPAASVVVPLLRNCPSGGNAARGLTPAVFAACLDAAGAIVAAAWDEPTFVGARGELASVAQAAIVDSAAASEVRASAHRFFGAVALASFEEFASHLPQVVAPAVEALHAVDGSEAGAGSRRRAVRTGGQEERTAAIEALGSYACAVGPTFAGHLAVVLPAVCAQAQHASPGVRSATARTLERIGRCLGDLAASLPEGGSDRAAAASLARQVVGAVCHLIDGPGLDGSEALRCGLQTKEDLMECGGFIALAGQEAHVALSSAGGGKRSEDVESSDGEDDDLDDAED